MTLDAEPVLYVERGGKGLVPLREPDDAWLRHALEALADAVSAAACRGSASSASTASRSWARRWARCSIELGFRQSPRRLTLSA